MGSLLSMVLAEQNSLKLTKSICTCQGKKLFPLNQFSRKFHLKIFQGSLSRQQLCDNRSNRGHGCCYA